MKTELTFQRELWPGIKEAMFGKKEVRCYYCRKKITTENVGGVSKTGVFCENIAHMIRESWKDVKPKDKKKLIKKIKEEENEYSKDYFG